MKTVRLRFHRERLLSDTLRRPSPYLLAGSSVCWSGTRRWVKRVWSSAPPLTDMRQNTFPPPLTTARVVVDGRPVQLQLYDMAGQDEFERLRPLCYREADVFLLCYSVVLPSSFRSVSAHWVPEVHRLCPGIPIILVGTQSDLREDVQVLIRLSDSQENPVRGDDTRLCARSIGAVTFAECSALTQKNLKEVLDSAILASMQHAEEAAVWPRMHTLRDKTPDKIKQLPETWWRKLSCVQSFDLQ
ncbi:rho-related GTP-binding protein RhoU [Carassius gibelio]|uniref:rho-related GTP-binding protein RhoU n=1 Tax=Carassius gibelio TaxID=101364 RepID=UPI002279C0EB|nr:rho-related GTP-binding protein RhoU [Carassius gibelio]